MAIWTNWDKLEEVVVGDCYRPGDLDWLIDAEVRDLFNVILKETKEDLDKIAQCLRDLGVIVYRPDILKFSEPIELPWVKSFNPMAPIVPRDQYLVYGENIYQTYTSLSDRYFDSVSYYNIFKKLFTEGHEWYSMPPPKINVSMNWHTSGEKIYHKILKDRILWHTATMFKCGDILITNTLGPGTALGLEWMQRYLPPETKIIQNNETPMNNFGHIDHGFFMTDDETVFCKNIGWVPEVLRKKKIIEVESMPKEKLSVYLKEGIFWKAYEKLFTEYQTVEEKIGKTRIRKWFDQWKGYSQKVDFDTNALVVDEKNVIFAKDVPGPLFELLDKHGVKSHVCEQRHGLFWDGGVHCFTLDLKRSGNKRSII